MSEVENVPDSTSDEKVVRDLATHVAVLRRKVPKECAESVRVCKKHEIDSRLNAPHEPLVCPDEIVCNMPDEETKQYMKSLSEKQINTDKICQEMESALQKLKEVAELYQSKFKKKPS